MSVAVVGNSVFVTAFELLGAYGFIVEKEAVRETIKELLKDEKFKIIIIPEKFTNITSDIRMEALKKRKNSPIFIVIPGLKGEAKGARVQELKKLISFAAGVELK